MKKNLIFLLCLAAVSCRQVPENEFHIEGYLTGVKDSTVIALFHNEGNVGRTVAMDTLINGRFSFAFPLTEPATLSLGGDYRSPEFPPMGRQIWAVPGEKATVRGDNTLLFTWKVKSRVPEQKEADRYMLQSKAEYDRLQLVSIEQKNWVRQHTKSPQDMNTARARELHDSLDQATHNLNNIIFRNDIGVMNETGVSEIWLEKLRMLSAMIKHYEVEYTQLRPDAERLYERLTPEQKELPTAQEVRLNLFPPQKVEIGEMMADAELKDLEGNLHKLSDYLGKYILLDFWSTGCGPCVEAMPELKEMKEKYADKLDIIGINIETDESSWAKSSEKFGITWLDLNAPQGHEIQARYGLRGIPYQVLISPGGIILDSWAGYGKGYLKMKLLEHIGK